MPQGGIDEGEAAGDAARPRALRGDERPLRRAAWRGGGLADLRHPDAARGARWKGRYIGQRQKWLAFRFTGEESEIDVERPGGGEHKPEFGAWRWERLERVPKLIVPFKRAVYEKVAEAFAPFARPVG